MGAPCSARITVAALIVSAACAGPMPTDSHVDTSSLSARSAAIASVPSTHAPAYDVHEWGLVRADQGDTVRIGAVAPPLPPEVLIMDKPVLYFHADAPMTLDRVSVSAPGGQVIETWPLAQPGPTEHTRGWAGVSIDPLSACKSSPLPRKGEPPCSKLRADDECESLGLAAVRTVDSSCVRVGDKVETFLFYRVETSSLTPPLRFASQNDGGVLVSNDGDEPIPGLLIRIETAFDQTRTLSVRPPPPHGTAVVGREFPAAKMDPTAEENDLPPGAPRPRLVTGPARDDLRSTLQGFGLTESEVKSFMKAWDETLFGSPSSGRGGLRPIKAGTTFLYFLPESTLERAAKVTFEPPPRTFRRAFAVWTHLAPSGEGR